MFWAPPSETAAQTAPVHQESTAVWVRPAAIALTAHQTFANASSISKVTVSAVLPRWATLAPYILNVLPELARMVTVKHYQQRALASTQINAWLALCAESHLLLMQPVLWPPLQLS